ncbi:MAG: glycosyltransferase family 4 protein [Deltaproteobacteria bacterium]|nr:glycosyltransferase family 4 protein [Deltaproteobacteria bacterium]
MKIALSYVDGWAFYHFRKGLIQELVRRGFHVSVIVSPSDFDRKLEALGVRVIPVPMERFFSPARDLLLFWRLYQVFRSERFDLVHNNTIKLNIYGTVAAALAGIRRRVCLVSGLGFVFAPYLSRQMGLLRFFSLWLYKLAMALSQKTWFQNPDDFAFFVEHEIIPPHKGVVIRSGGVNLEEFSPEAVDRETLAALRQELGLPSNASCVLMATARLIWSKGVREFVEAAFRLEARYPDWYFVMVSPRELGSPDSVPQEYLEAHRPARFIHIDTLRHDIHSFVALSDIMALPSYYPEGVPRGLLEGLAMAKPIITTDHPGCREVVEEGKNGYLIPICDSETLANRLAVLMDDPGKRAEFGKYSRMKAQREFGEALVVERIIREVYEIN